MTKNLIVLALCFLNSSALFAQRHGRADSIENFARHEPSTHLQLQIRSEGARTYFCTSDLREMSRTVVILQDSTTGISHKYEGVALDHLLPSRDPHLGSETIEVFYGHDQKMTLTDSTAASHSQSLLADTIDGKWLTGYVPYSLIIQDGTATGVIAQLTNVDLINVKMSPQ